MAIISCLVYLLSRRMANIHSLTLAMTVRKPSTFISRPIYTGSSSPNSIDRVLNKFLANCWVIVLPPPAVPSENTTRNMDLKSIPECEVKRASSVEINVLTMFKGNCSNSNGFRFSRKYFPISWPSSDIIKEAAWLFGFSNSCKLGIPPNNQRKLKLTASKNKTPETVPIIKNL